MIICFDGSKKYYDIFPSSEKSKEKERKQSVWEWMLIVKKKDYIAKLVEQNL